MDGRMVQTADAHCSAKGKQTVNNNLTKSESTYLGWIKCLPCGVCGQTGQIEAHHIRQHKQYICIPLCADCHRGAFNGIHGQKRIWNVLKVDEIDILNDTIKKLTQACKR
jgi:hypothetical protein